MGSGKSWRHDAITRRRGGRKSGATRGPPRPSRAVWPWLLLTIVAIVGWRELREVDFVRVRVLLRVTYIARRAPARRDERVRGTRLGLRHHA